MFDECVQIACSELSLESGEHEDISSFEIFRGIGKVLSIHSYQSMQNGLLQASFIEYQWVHKGSRNSSSGTDHCLAGLLELRKTYPLTYIYKETFRDKLVDWFVKGDIDFKDQKQFSRSFHVVSKDREKLSQLLLGKQLDSFLDFPDMLVEINGNRCMFRTSDQPLSEEGTRQFTNLARTLRKVLD